MRAIRATFYLLVLTNLLLFAHGQSWFGRAGGAETDRLAGQLEPERIRIVGKGSAPAQPLRTEAPSEECRALAGLSAEQAQKLAALFRDGQLQVVQRPQMEPTAWWVVYIPPQLSQQVEKKATELKQLGVQEYFVVQDEGPNRYAVSLGPYKSLQGAKDRLETLQKQGVCSARIEVWEAPGDMLVLEVRGPTEYLSKALANLPKEFTALPAGVCLVGK